MFCLFFNSLMCFCFRRWLSLRWHDTRAVIHFLFSSRFHICTVSPCRLLPNVSLLVFLIYWVVFCYNLILTLTLDFWICGCSLPIRTCDSWYYPQLLDQQLFFADSHSRLLILPSVSRHVVALLSFIYAPIIPDGRWDRQHGG